APSGGLVTELRSQHRGHAVHRGLLDSALRDLGRTRVRGVSGQRAAHQESAGAQERCAGEPVVAKVAYLRVTKQLVPTTSRDSSATNLLEATRRTRSGRGDVHSADRESVDTDVLAVGECDERNKRAGW